MKRSRLLAGLALFLAVIAYETCFRQRSVAESTIKFGLPILIILTARLIPRSYSVTKKTWIAVAGMLFCALVNLLQLVLPGKIIEAVAFGFTFGVMFTIFVRSNRTEVA